MLRITRCSHAAAIASLLLSLSTWAVADEASDRAALEAAAQSWVKAFNARDTDALMARSTPEVVFIDAGTASPVSGRAAARDAWARALRGEGGRLTSATKEAVIAGDVAWRIGSLGHTMGSVTVRSQSLEIWKRIGGEWKLHRQMSTGLLAPTPLATTPSQPVYDKPTN